MPPPYRIGLTGDVGAGKSRVGAWLAARGAAVCDADRVVHELLARDEAVVAAVAGRFGEGVRGVAGIDRAALADAVFDDPAALFDLEAIVHPAVRAFVARWWAEREAAVGADAAEAEADTEAGAEGASAAAGVTVIEAVKLVESGMGASCHAVWVVTCAAAERRARLAARGWSAAEIARRMARGTPLGPRLAAADVIVDNSGPWPHTEVQLARAWRMVEGRT